MAGVACLGCFLLLFCFVFVLHLAIRSLYHWTRVLPSRMLENISSSMGELLEAEEFSGAS